MTLVEEVEGAIQRVDLVQLKLQERLRALQCSRRSGGAVYLFIRF